MAEYKVTFTKPFKWEDKEYKEIDLSGLENLTGAQYCEAVKEFNKKGNVSVMIQLDPDFACIIANMVTGIPIEFFYAMPARELNSVKNAVSSYFFAVDSED